MIRQLLGVGYAACGRPIAASVLCCLLCLPACATVPAAPASAATKKASSCEPAKAPRPANPLQNEVRPIGTCKEPVRDETKGKANDQDDQVLY